MSQPQDQGGSTGAPPIHAALPVTTAFEFPEWKTDRYVGKLLHIKAGQCLSRQYHRVKEETLMVQAGEIEARVSAADVAAQPHLPIGFGKRTEREG